MPSDHGPGVAGAAQPSRPGLVERALSARRLPACLALTAVLLSAPSLGLGLQNDDQLLRLALLHSAELPEWGRGAINLFAFYRGDPTAIREAIDRGLAPWWTPPDFRIAFFRPLSGLTHWLDFRLWPERPWLMHAQSIAWFVAAVVAAAMLYRRLLQPAWVAGLAALFFAIDDAHGLPAYWIANRNASVAAFFAFLALWAHHRWRSEGWRAGSVLGPVCLAVGLLGGEVALGVCGYLFAYVVCLDRGPFGRRLASLGPSAVIVAAWALGYRMLGYGVNGSAMYIDPGAHPAAFAEAVVGRAPLLLFGQFALPSGLYVLLSSAARRAMFTAACVVVASMTALLAPLVARDRVARFFALGLLLSVLPACSTFPHDRLLFLAGFGGMGLLAQFFGAMKERAAWLPARAAWRWTARLAVPLLLAIHLLLAPVALLATGSSVRAFSGVLERAGLSIPSDPSIAGQWLIVVNTPAAYVSTVGLAWPRLEGRVMPSRLLVVGAGIHPIQVARPTARTIVVHPEGGFLQPSGSPRPGHERDQPPFDMRYMLPMFDGLFRAGPFRRGDSITASGVRIEIDATTADGRPDVVSYRFDTELESQTLRWVQWRGGVYAPFVLPKVGQTVVLPAVEVPF